jgi:hypothetical protein
LPRAIGCRGRRARAMSNDARAWAGILGCCGLAILNSNIAKMKTVRMDGVTVTRWSPPKTPHHQPKQCMLYLVVFVVSVPVPLIASTRIYTFTLTLQTPPAPGLTIARALRELWKLSSVELWKLSGSCATTEPFNTVVNCRWCGWCSYNSYKLQLTLVVASGVDGATISISITRKTYVLIISIGIDAVFKWSNYLHRQIYQQ